MYIPSVVFNMPWLSIFFVCMHTGTHVCVVCDNRSQRSSSGVVAWVPPILVSFGFEVEHLTGLELVIRLDWLAQECQDLPILAFPGLALQEQSTLLRVRSFCHRGLHLSDEQTLDPCALCIYLPDIWLVVYLPVSTFLPTARFLSCAWVHNKS